MQLEPNIGGYNSPNSELEELLRDWVTNKANILQLNSIHNPTPFYRTQGYPPVQCPFSSRYMSTWLYSALWSLHACLLGRSWFHLPFRRPSTSAESCSSSPLGRLRSVRGSRLLVPRRTSSSPNQTCSGLNRGRPLLIGPKGGPPRSKGPSLDPQHLNNTTHMSPISWLGKICYLHFSLMVCKNLRVGGTCPLTCV
jgi:hypothetical protein